MPTPHLADAAGGAAFIADCAAPIPGECREWIERVGRQAGVPERLLEMLTQARCGEKVDETATLMKTMPTKRVVV